MQVNLMDERLEYQHCRFDLPRPKARRLREEKGRDPYDGLRPWSAVTHGAGVGLGILGAVLLLLLTVQTGAAWHIVDDNRLVRRIVDRLVMTEHALLRRTGVVWRDHEHRIGARLLRLLHHAHGVCVSLEPAPEMPGTSTTSLTA